MNSSGSIEIDRPIADVFRITTEQVTQWSQIVVTDEVIEEVEGGVGTTFRVVTEDRGRSMEFAGIVTRNDPPLAHSIRMEGRHFNIEANYEFEDLGGRTRVTHGSKVEGLGLTKVLFFAFGWMMKKQSCDALEKELQSLKSHTESTVAPTS